MPTRIVCGFSSQGREGVIVSEDPAHVKDALIDKTESWTKLTRARGEQAVWISVAHVLYFEDASPQAGDPPSK
jgi:hypothetical protein